MVAIEYFIEINGKYVKSFKRKANSFKWVEKHIQMLKQCVDLEEYPALIRIWEHKGKEGSECIYENNISE